MDYRQTITPALERQMLIFYRYLGSGNIVRLTGGLQKLSTEEHLMNVLWADLTRGACARERENGKVKQDGSVMYSLDTLLRSRFRQR